MLVPPLERNGKVTPVKGRISTVPRQFRDAWISKIPAAVQPPMQ